MDNRKCFHFCNGSSSYDAIGFNPQWNAIIWLRMFLTVWNILQIPCGCVVYGVTWWRHQMETFSALLAICAGNSPVTGEFPTQRPVTRSFDVFFDLCLNKRLRKQSWGWWFEMISCPLWRHRNEMQLSNTILSSFLTTSCSANPCLWLLGNVVITHYDVIKSKDVSRHRLFVRGIHRRSPVVSLTKGQWRGPLMLLCWQSEIKKLLNKHRLTGNLWRHHGHMMLP